MTLTRTSNTALPVLFACLALLLPTSATAEDGMMVEEEIVVIGSRGQPRTVTDSAAPVDSFTRDELTAQGSADFRDILRNTVPSFNVDRFPLHDERSFSRPSTLRGLTADQTLILLNGKRRHRGSIINRGTSPTVGSTQPVDLNTIPSIALGRVEVLRDGAAAQYGSDAIAGVINLVLREDTETTSFSLTSGYYDKKDDGDRNVFSLYTGNSFSDGDGFWSFAIETSEEDATNRGYQDSRARGLINGGADAFNANCVGEENFGNPDCSVGRYGLYPVDTSAFRAPVVTSWGAPDAESTKILLNTSYQTSDSARLYATLTWAEADTLVSFFWRNPTNRGGVFNPPDEARAVSPTIPNPDHDPENPNPEIPETISNPDYNAALAGVDFRMFYPGGYTPQYVGEGSDTSLRLGYSDSIDEDWEYDLSIGFGTNEYDLFLYGSLNPAYGMDTPTSFYLGTLQNTLINTNLDFRRGYDLGDGNSASLAIGFEINSEEYEVTAGDQASWDYIRDYATCEADGIAAADCTLPLYPGMSVGSHGAQGNSADQAGTWSRDSRAAYIDAEFDMDDTTLVGLAFRTEDYDDFGSTADAKAAVRTRLGESSNFRSTLSTGFRAPTVGQVNSSNIATRVRDGMFFADGDFAPGHPVSQYFGAQPLEPETSINFSAGFTGDLEAGGYWSIDYYNIRVFDRIRVSEEYSVGDLTDAQRDDLRAIAGPVVDSIDSIRYFSNEFNTETTGVDIVFSLPLPDGWGITFAHNYNKTEVTRRNASSLSLDAVNDLENNLPNHRLTSTVNYRGENLSFMARGNYYGRWETYSGANVNYRDKSAFMVDTSLNIYVVDNRGTLTFGVDNLFDHYPEAIPYQNSTNARVFPWGLPYSNETPYGYQGRFVYARFDYNFDH